MRILPLASLWFALALSPALSPAWASDTKLNQSDSTTQVSTTAGGNPNGVHSDMQGKPQRTTSSACTNPSGVQSDMQGGPNRTTSSACTNPDGVVAK